MKKFILLLILLHINLYAQKVGTTSAPSTFVPQGHVLSSINSMGFSRLINQQVSNVGNINPASLSQFENLSFGISYQFETDVTPAWIAGLGHSRSQLAKPQSFGLVVRDDQFRYALSFNQRYNSFVDFGDIPITTVEHPEGTGETFSPHIKELIDSYSTNVSYTFFDGPNEVSLGAKLDFNILSHEEEILHTVAHTSGFSISGAIGLNYQLDENITIGLFYERAPEFEEKVTFKSSGLVPVDIDTSGLGYNPAFIIDPPDIFLKSKMPDILNMAISVRHSETYTSVFDLTYIFWEQHTKNSNNNLDISSSILASLQEDIIFSFGFLLTDRDYGNETNSAFGTNSKLDGLFLLVGLKEKFDTFDFNITVVSSHLGSGKWREQLIAKVGIDYCF